MPSVTVLFSNGARSFYSTEKENKRDYNTTLLCKKLERLTYCLNTFGIYDGNTLLAISHVKSVAHVID